MNDHEIQCTKGPTFVFRGELLASVSSKRHDSDERWSVLEVFRTVGGNYVCFSRGMTTRKHESEIVDGYNSGKDLNKCREFFGYKYLAKELYDKIGVSYVEEIP